MLKECSASIAVIKLPVMMNACSARPPGTAICRAARIFSSIKLRQPRNRPCVIEYTGAHTIAAAGLAIITKKSTSETTSDAIMLIMNSGG